MSSTDPVWPSYDRWSTIHSVSLGFQTWMLCEQSPVASNPREQPGANDEVRGMNLYLVQLVTNRSQNLNREHRVYCLSMRRQLTFVGMSTECKYWLRWFLIAHIGGHHGRIVDSLYQPCKIPDMHFAAIRPGRCYFLIVDHSRLSRGNGLMRDLWFPSVPTLIRLTPP